MVAVCLSTICSLSLDILFVSDHNLVIFLLFGRLMLTYVFTVFDVLIAHRRLVTFLYLQFIVYYSWLYFAYSNLFLIIFSSLSIRKCPRSVNYLLYLFMFKRRGVHLKRAN